MSDTPASSHFALITSGWDAAHVPALERPDTKSRCYSVVRSSERFQAVVRTRK
jgi:hypothetical protein